MCLNSHNYFPGKKYKEFLKMVILEMMNSNRNGWKGILSCFYVVPLLFQFYNHIHVLLLLYNVN